MVLILLIAVAIVAMVLSGVFSGGKNPVEEAVDSLDRVEKRLNDNQVRELTHALNRYAMDTGKFPETLDTLIPDYIRHPAMLIDPWGTPFRLVTNGSSQSALLSAGPDGLFNTLDDIKRRL